MFYLKLLFNFIGLEIKLVGLISFVNFEISIKGLNVKFSYFKYFGFKKPKKFSNGNQVQYLMYLLFILFKRLCKNIPLFRNREIIRFFSEI